MAYTEQKYDAHRWAPRARRVCDLRQTVHSRIVPFFSLY